MRMDNIKTEHDRAIEFRNRINAMNFCIGLITNELKSIVYSPDFSKLPEDTMQQMVLSRAKAIRFWVIVRDKYQDAYLQDMINKASQSSLEELQMTMEEAMEMMDIHDLARPVVMPNSVHKPKVEPSIEKKDKKDAANTSDDEILKELMAQQNA